MSRGLLDRNISLTLPLYQEKKYVNKTPVYGSEC